MPTPTRSRLRIAADIFNYDDFEDALRSGISGYIPKFRAGDDLQIEVALFDDSTLLDISNVASLTLEIKPIEQEVSEAFDNDDESGTDLRGPHFGTGLLLSETVESAAMNGSLTQTEWDSEAADKAHAIFALTSEQTRLAPGDRWLSISLLSSDDPAFVRTVCAGRIRILGGGQYFDSEAE